MTTLEKVIKGLECCGDKMDCNECPFSDFSGLGCFEHLREAALELLKAQKWISVKDRLPESSYMVVCVDINHDVYVTQYSCRYKKFNAYDTDGGDMFALETVTHWMPLPEPPKEGDSE